MQLNIGNKGELVIGVLLLLAVLAGGYRQYTLAQELLQTTERFAIETVNYQEQLSRLAGDLAREKEEKEILSEDLEIEQKKNGTFEQEIKKIAETVGELDKLRRLDPELLLKYSKVFFLNEHYVPPELAAVDSKYLLDQKREMEVHGAVWPFLKKMLERAERDGVELRVASAYRSFGTQAALKAGYTVVYGSGANTFSADQGYSEHQLGTTVDLATPAQTALVVSFEQTEAFKWLTENAYRYGFVLSYPKGNTYYQYEPWHWRFVGEDLARKLERDGKYFYDLEQREIDKYLISIFD